MDTSSDAATAESVTQHDEKTLEEYQDPNSAYPHASSLRRPQGIAVHRELSNRKINLSMTLLRTMIWQISTFTVYIQNYEKYKKYEI